MPKILLQDDDVVPWNEAKGIFPSLERRYLLRLARSKKLERKCLGPLGYRYFEC